MSSSMFRPAAAADRRWLVGLACASLGAVAFSGKAIVAKLMYRMGADAFSVVGLRMLMAFPLFLAMAWWSMRVKPGQPALPPLTPRQRWQILALGVTGYYLASTLDFLGLQYISASLERAILYLNPTMVLLLSALVWRRAIRPAQLLAMALAYAGVVVIWLHDWQTASLLAQGQSAAQATRSLALGSLLVLGSALSYAVYLMGSGELVQRIGSLRLISHASLVACVLCVLQWGLVWFFSEGRLGAVQALPWQVGVLSAVNAVVCTALPVFLVMRGVELLGASLAAQVGMVGPLSTLWMAAWWLGEPVTGRLLMGTAAILAGIVILGRDSRR